MKEYTDEQIAQMYDNLPEDLKDSIFGVDTTNKVNEIGKKYNLTIDKIGDLANETGMVMLGVTHPNEFIANLIDRLEVDKEQARIIAEEINEQIFKPVRDSLRKIHDTRDEESQNTKIGDNKEETSKENILKEIEKDHNQEETPAILQGVTNPFDAKMKKEIYKAPVEEKTIEPLLPEKPKTKYDNLDPYREQIG